MSRTLFLEPSLLVVVQTTEFQRLLHSSFSFLSWVQASACLSRESSLNPLKELIPGQEVHTMVNQRMDSLKGKVTSRIDLVSHSGEYMHG